MTSTIEKPKEVRTQDTTEAPAVHRVRTITKKRGGAKRGARRAPRSEYNEKMVDLRRVSRVVKGGKRFSFRATLIMGDGKGKVGVGTGKGLDVAKAMEKARNDAKKQMIVVPVKGTSIPHDVSAKYSAAQVLIKPAQKGSGLKAGGATRAVLLLAGIKDATAKCVGKTKNKLTNALATLEALKQLRAEK